MITFGTDMRAATRTGIRGDRIDAALPPALRHRLPAAATTPALTYTLLLFPHTADDVVPSSAVTKALRRVDADARVVAAAGNFTEEARQALSERGAMFVTLSDYSWTDERHATHRERMAALRGT